jgi:hypothetical protein
MRDPLPEEINTPEFEAVWKCIKNWDIGIPEDIMPNGGQLYSHGTGNHVVAILDALRKKGFRFNTATDTNNPEPNLLDRDTNEQPE